MVSPSTSNRIPSGKVETVPVAPFGCLEWIGLPFWTTCSGPIPVSDGPSCDQVGNCGVDLDNPKKHDNVKDQEECPEIRELDVIRPKRDQVRTGNGRVLHATIK